MIPTSTKYLLLFLLISFEFLCVLGSGGDLSPFYQQCVMRCLERNCTTGGMFKDFKDSSMKVEQPIVNQLMMWSCHDECQYSCMWTTVSAFQGRGWSVPQFYGKWPFVRLFGLQEVASVIFSAFNFLSQFIFLNRLVRELGPDYPYFWTWVVYSMVSLNSWIWSMVFHARDTPFTEMMDYLSAYSVVVYFLFSFCLRVLGNIMPASTFIFGFLCSMLYFHHATYLLYIKFDYSYNMMVNISVGNLHTLCVPGVLSSLAWLVWAFRQRKQMPYVRHLIQFLLLVGATMTLEILDFPPLLWLFDAHALWHLSTIPLPFILVRFVIGDCKFLKILESKKP